MGSSGQGQVLIATTDQVAGHRTVTTFGLVLGISVRSRGLAGNIMAGLQSLGNGSALEEYRDDLVDARQEALAQLAAQARDRGANAVLRVQFDTAEVGHDMSEIVAYGTAAIIERGA